MSDRTINITILPMTLARSDGQPSKAGIEHISFTTVTTRRAPRARRGGQRPQEIRRVNLGNAA